MENQRNKESSDADEYLNFLKRKLNSGQELKSTEKARLYKDKSFISKIDNAYINFLKNKKLNGNFLVVEEEEIIKGTPPKIAYLIGKESEGGFLNREEDALVKKHYFKKGAEKERKKIHDLLYPKINL